MLERHVSRIRIVMDSVTLVLNCLESTTILKMTRFLVLVVLLPTAALEKCAEGKLNKGGWYLCIGPD